MIISFASPKGHFIRKIVSGFVVVTFVFTLIIPPQARAQMMVPQSVLNLPPVGTMVMPSDAFNPAIIRGMTIYPENPLQFSFIVNKGDDGVDGKKLEKESLKMVKYFLASLTVPEKEMWVNLSPHEKDRIVPEKLGVTELGRDLLAQDYLLKQLTASLIYPENKLGKTFWQKVYDKAYQQFGTTEVPLDTFNKVWIVPDHAKVYVNGNNAFVVDSHLKVMLEEDYLSSQQSVTSSQKRNLSTDHWPLATEIIRQIIIPAIEKEVNTGKTFANLRQIYNSMILATWYKQNLKESLLGKVYVNQNKVEGVDVVDKNVKEKIYEQYLQAFKKGVYNYIKEDYDPQKQEIVNRKYFSGGLTGYVGKVPVVKDSAMLTGPQKALASSGSSNTSTVTVDLLENSTKEAAKAFAAQMKQEARSNRNGRSLAQGTALATVKEFGFVSHLLSDALGFLNDPSDVMKNTIVNVKADLLRLIKEEKVIVHKYIDENKRSVTSVYILNDDPAEQMKDKNGVEVIHLRRNANATVQASYADQVTFDLYKNAVAPEFFWDKAMVAIDQDNMAQAVTMIRRAKGAVILPMPSMDLSLGNQIIQIFRGSQIKSNDLLKKGWVDQRQGAFIINVSGKYYRFIEQKNMGSLSQISSVFDISPVTKTELETLQSFQASRVALEIEKDSGMISLSDEGFAKTLESFGPREKIREDEFRKRLNKKGYKNFSWISVLLHFKVAISGGKLFWGKDEKGAFWTKTQIKKAIPQQRDDGVLPWVDYTQKVIDRSMTVEVMDGKSQKEVEGFFSAVATSEKQKGPRHIKFNPGDEDKLRYNLARIKDFSPYIKNREIVFLRDRQGEIKRVFSLWTPPLSNSPWSIPFGLLPPQIAVSLELISEDQNRENTYFFKKVPMEFFSLLKRYKDVQRVIETYDYNEKIYPQEFLSRIFSQLGNHPTEEQTAREILNIETRAMRLAHDLKHGYYYRFKKVSDPDQAMVSLEEMGEISETILSNLADRALNPLSDSSGSIKLWVADSLHKGKYEKTMVAFQFAQKLADSFDLKYNFSDGAVILVLSSDKKAIDLLPLVTKKIETWAKEGFPSFYKLIPGETRYIRGYTSTLLSFGGTQEVYTVAPGVVRRGETRLSDRYNVQNDEGEMIAVINTASEYGISITNIHHNQPLSIEVNRPRREDSAMLSYLNADNFEDAADFYDELLDNKKRIQVKAKDTEAKEFLESLPEFDDLSNGTVLFDGINDRLVIVAESGNFLFEPEKKNKKFDFSLRKLTQEESTEIFANVRERETMDLEAQEKFLQQTDESDGGLGVDDDMDKFLNGDDYAMTSREDYSYEELAQFTSVIEDEMGEVVYDDIDEKTGEREIVLPTLTIKIFSEDKEAVVTVEFNRDDLILDPYKTSRLGADYFKHESWEDIQEDLLKYLQQEMDFAMGTDISDQVTGYRSENFSQIIEPRDLRPETFAKQPDAAMQVRVHANNYPDFKDFIQRFDDAPDSRKRINLMYVIPGMNKDAQMKLARDFIDQKPYKKLMETLSLQSLLDVSPHLINFKNGIVNSIQLNLGNNKVIAVSVDGDTFSVTPVSPAVYIISWNDAQQLQMKDLFYPVMSSNKTDDVLAFLVAFKKDLEVTYKNLAKKTNKPEVDKSDLIDAIERYMGQDMRIVIYEDASRKNIIGLIFIDNDDVLEIRRVAKGASGEKDDFLFLEYLYKEREAPLQDLLDQALKNKVAEAGTSIKKIRKNLVDNGFDMAMMGNKKTREITAEAIDLLLNHLDHPKFTANKTYRFILFDRSAFYGQEDFLNKDLVDQRIKNDKAFWNKVENLAKGVVARIFEQNGWKNEQPQFEYVFNKFVVNLKGVRGKKREVFFRDMEQLLLDDGALNEIDPTISNRNLKRKAPLPVISEQRAEQWKKARETKQPPQTAESVWGKRKVKTADVQAENSERGIVAIKSPSNKIVVLKKKKKVGSESATDGDVIEPEKEAAKVASVGQGRQVQSRGDKSDAAMGAKDGRSSFVDRGSSDMSQNLTPNTQDLYGGINLDASLLDLQIKRDANWVPLPMDQQDFENMNIRGFVPVIIDISPTLNLPMLLGFDYDAEDGQRQADKGSDGVQLQLGELKARFKVEELFRC